MFYDMTREIEILKAEGYSYEELKAKFELIDNQATNRNRQNQVLRLVREIKEKRARAARMQEPHFVWGDDCWEVIAKGTDFFINGYGAPAVKVRKRNGEITIVEVIETVDMESDQVRHWTVQ